MLEDLKTHIDWLAAQLTWSPDYRKSIFKDVEATPQGFRDLLCRWSLFQGAEEVQQLLACIGKADLTAQAELAMRCALRHANLPCWAGQLATWASPKDEDERAQTLLVFEDPLVYGCRVSVRAFQEMSSRVRVSPVQRTVLGELWGLDAAVRVAGGAAPPDVLGIHVIPTENQLNPLPDKQQLP